MRELPSPTPGPGQVLVRTRVAAVSFPDALMVAGKYQFKPEFPFSPGGEFSGEVMAVGSEVTRLHVGDRLVGITPFGAHAQYVVVDAANTIALPADISDQDLELAGSFVLTYALRCMH
ncbi:MAG: alcohol dehydrogenase catalytic domain-containing protein [Pseudoxanthomonas sp.]